MASNRNLVHSNGNLHHGVQLERIQLQPICNGFSQGRVVNTWADILNRANLGFEVMHERNAHNFPLDLASGDDCSCSINSTFHQRLS